MVMTGRRFRDAIFWRVRKLTKSVDLSPEDVFYFGLGSTRPRASARTSLAHAEEKLEAEETLVLTPLLYRYYSVGNFLM
jgi:hypothetical protein